MVVVFVDGDADKHYFSETVFFSGNFSSEWEKKFGKDLFVSNWKTCS